MAVLSEAEIIAAYSPHDPGVVFVEGLKAVADLATKRTLEATIAAVQSLQEDVDPPCCRAARAEILVVLGVVAGHAPVKG